MTRNFSREFEKIREKECRKRDYDRTKEMRARRLRSFVAVRESQALRFDRHRTCASITARKYVVAIVSGSDSVTNEITEKSLSKVSVIVLGNNSRQPRMYIQPMEQHTEEDRYTFEVRGAF